MSVYAKVLMCTAVLCVAGVRAESENWEETRADKATSDVTAETTDEPTAPLGPINGPVTPVPAVANQIVLGINFTVVGDFSKVFFPNGTPYTSLVSGLRTDITQGARNSTDKSLEQFTLMDSVTNGSADVASRLILSPDQFTGSEEDKIQAVKDLAASIEAMTGNSILGDQAGLMAATGRSEKFDVTGLKFSREEPSGPSGASAHGVVVMVGALFAALMAL